MVKFGDTEVNDALDWSKWTYKELVNFCETSIKNAKETPEEIAKVLGVKVPVQKPKEKES